MSELGNVLNVQAMQGKVAVKTLSPHVVYVAASLSRPSSGVDFERPCLVLLAPGASQSLVYPALSSGILSNWCWFGSLTVFCLFCERVWLSSLSIVFLRSLM